MQMQPRASVRYHQAMLANGAKWLITDPLGVVNTLKDKQGYTEIVTTAVSGLFYLTRPLTDFHGGPVDPSTELVAVRALTTLSGSVGGATGDQLFAGTSDNADPTAGGALFDVAGFYWWTVGTLKVGVRNEAVASVSANVTADRALYEQATLYGDTENAQYAHGYNAVGGPKLASRAQASLPRAYAPTHLCVAVLNNTAAIKTFHAAVGFHVGPSLGDMLVEPRS